MRADETVKNVREKSHSKQNNVASPSASSSSLVDARYHSEAIKISFSVPLFGFVLFNLCLKH